ncbi:PF06252 family protein [Leptospira interrogans str. 2003000735]|uniref:PF06252 family protein n=2 Tax=Leptospira interrogans TaxID=173 RepID=A0A829DCA9_LEPIR|nr:PF06252 family protein [Leptospira interrogans str. 2002000624]EKQ40282.1 PF06252 family protein [Leptospira interrogans str. 2002000621]EKQ46012.1 PF06252 family protein [Leptospira interrogans str. 2002000623]EMJ68641.1 PF06252 family protein [Leptospira interrogans str. 2003000735]EMJ72813.1 PF06252 family protein [Leptospira interrogans str. 2002000632]EMJ76911.1 PF06252 family protein [Leptospira interrogans str. 2002000631]EMY06251.1 PF06252 family protein [Leptospira interrogans str
MSSLSQIWTLKSKAEISEENFRNLIESVSGKRSTKNLSKMELEKIATAIYKLHPELKRKRIRKRTPHKYASIPKKSSTVTSILTPDQDALIKNLVSALNLSSEYKNLTDDSLPLKMFKSKLNELSRHEAQSVTEALKRILIRANQEQFDQLLKTGMTRSESVLRILRLILVRGIGKRALDTKNQLDTYDPYIVLKGIDKAKVLMKEFNKKQSERTSN